MQNVFQIYVNISNITSLPYDTIYQNIIKNTKIESQSQFMSKQDKASRVSSSLNQHVSPNKNSDANTKNIPQQSSLSSLKSPSNNKACCSSPHTATSSSSSPNSNIFNCKCQSECRCSCPQCYTCYRAPLKSILGMSIFHTLFYLIPILCIYWIITMNMYAIVIGICISVVQSLTIKGRSQVYVRTIVRIFMPNKYVGISRVYEEGQDIVVPQNSNSSNNIQKQSQSQNNNNAKDRQDPRTIYSYFPHSVFGYGIIFNTNHPDYPGEPLTNSYIIGSNFILMVPILGAHLKLWGVTGADAANFKKLLTHNKTISILPGGYQQATLTTPSQVRIYIKNRVGFIKYAMKYNYTIRPVLVLNQHKALWTFDYFLNLRLMLNKLKIPGVIYFCKWWGLFFPPWIKAKTIIGQALRSSKIYNISQNQQPSTQQIKEMHQKYISMVLELYQKYKEENGGCQIKVY